MTDAREMLHEITKTFAANCSKWLKHEVGVGQHALDDAAHQTDLEKLMGVLCENYDAFADIPLMAVTPSPVPAQRITDPNEVEHPGT